MNDKTCESWEAFPDGSEKTCRAPAKIMLNDFPCCEECFVEFEANGLVEKWEWLGEGEPSASLGAMVRIESRARQPSQRAVKP